MREWEGSIKLTFEHVFVELSVARVQLNRTSSLFKSSFLLYVYIYVYVFKHIFLGLFLICEELVFYYWDKLSTIIFVNIIKSPFYAPF